MRAAMQKLMLLTKRIQREGTSEHVLCEVIVTLADEVVRLDRELDQIKSTANRADRNARLGMRRV